MGDGSVEVGGRAVRFAASDGRKMAGTWFGGRDAAAHSVILLPAMATPARFYHPFAAFLASRGWGVLCFDYRGVGENSGDDKDVTLDAWRDLDLPAALAEVRRLAKPHRVAVVCHSIGGQLLGQSPIRHELDGALLVACQRGAPHLFSGVWRLRLEFAWRVLPVLIHLFGRVPPLRLLLSEHVPPRAVLQWIRWSRELHFTSWDGSDSEARFSEVEFPVTAVTIEDDAGFAPARAVEALSKLFPTCRRVTLRPRELGLPSIGHFPAFRIPQSQARLAALLEETLAAAPRRRR